MVAIAYQIQMTPMNSKEVFIKMEITGKEAHLLKVLRTINFGKVIVQKMDGKLVRVEPSESILLNDQDGLCL